MDVEIWSDLVCPWCYIAKRQFEAGLARFEHADDVRVTWRSFELDPRAPFLPGATMGQQLAAKFGRTEEEAAAILAGMDKRGAAVGLDYRLALTTGGNTFAAHRLIHLGAKHGVGDAVKEALLHAYFIELLPIGDPDVLAEVAAGVGLERREIDAVLAGDRFAAEVRADEAEAEKLGATGVPFFVFDRRLRVPGAQDPDTFLAALRRAYELAGG